MGYILFIQMFEDGETVQVFSTEIAGLEENQSV